MLYQKLIAESLNTDMEYAQRIMDKMSIGGFRFSSASEEAILEEALFIHTYVPPIN